MTIRIAAIEVGHWHAVHDAAYLRHLTAMPDVALVGVQDSDAALAKKRAAEAGNPPTFTDYPQMLAETKPDFVLGLGRHRQMAKIAHDLLDRGLPFMME
jgi:predicted dehydrogenase